MFFGLFDLQDPSVLEEEEGWGDVLFETTGMYRLAGVHVKPTLVRGERDLQDRMNMRQDD
ncbi:hypothetical protein E4U36_000343 [Claviceps purpurea]|nr:hypothetical protein E4U36_000343 [Claviceps purpurea]